MAAGFLMGIARLKPGVTAAGRRRSRGAQPAVSRGASRAARTPTRRRGSYATPLQERLVTRNPVDPADSGRRGRAGAADRVRQRREPDAGAGHGARQGDRGARRAGRRAARDLPANFWCESLLLAAAGAVCGIVIAEWGVSLLVARGADLPGFQPIRVDLPVLASAWHVAARRACCSA